MANTFPSSGNAGIETISPGWPLTVGSSIGASAHSSHKIITDGRIGAYDSNGKGASLMSVGSYGALFAYDYGSSVPLPLALNEYGGNVGIGLTNPATRLHIKSAGDSEVSIESSDTSARRWSLQSSGNAAGNLGKFQIIDRTAPASRLTIDANGKIGIATTGPQYPLDVAGDARATGNLIEKAVTFTPTTVGWYRIATAGGSSGGVIRIFNNGYDNTITDIEFQFNIGAYGQNGAIQQTRFSNYNGGAIGKARISSDGGANVYLDIYVKTAGTPQPLAIYGYGPNFAGFVASPVVGASAGSTDVKVLDLGPGFRSTFEQFLIISEAVPASGAAYASLGLGTNDNGGGFQHPVQIKAIAEAVPSGGSAPSSMGFFAGYNNVPAEYMRITSAGNVGIGTAGPAAKLEVVGDTYQNGGQRAKVSSINSNTTLDATYHTVLVDTSSGGTVTVTLPAAGSYSGREYRIKNKNKGTVMISGTVDGKSSGLRLKMNDAATLVSDGSGWFIF